MTTCLSWSKVKAGKRTVNLWNDWRPDSRRMVNLRMSTIGPD